MGEKNRKNTAYVWFDSEFTSLQADESHLLQVAMIITDTAIQRILPPECDIRLSVRLPDEAVVSMWVQEHIPGLVEQSRSAGAMRPEEVDRLLVSRLEQAIGGIPGEIGLRPVLAGNSIHADMNVIRKRLPVFADSLHYRMLDVSSWKIGWVDHFGREPLPKEQAELIENYGIGAAESLGGGEHDAYYDVCASIAEYRYYLSHLVCR